MIFLKNFHKVKSRYNKDTDFYISPIDQANFDLVIADEGTLFKKIYNLIVQNYLMILQRELNIVGY